MGMMNNNYKKLKANPQNIAMSLCVFLAPLLMCLFKKSPFALAFFIFSLVLINFVKIDKKLKFLILAIDLVPVVLIINTTSSYYTDILTLAGIYAVLGLGLNMIVGFTGMFNLGYVGYYLIGAYSYAIFASPQVTKFLKVTFLPLSGEWFWLFLIIGGLLAAGFGFLISLPVMRLKGDYLAVVSLGFAEILRLLANNMDNITNGPQGITPIQAPRLFGLVLNKPIDFYFIVLVLFILAIIVSIRLNNSKIGRAWTSIREDELAARTMGVPIVKFKILSFCIGAFFAGTMGVVFAAKQTYVDPSSFQFLESITILAIIILGGIGSIPGVITGALIISTLQTFFLKQLSLYLGALNNSGVVNLPSQLDPAKYEKFVFGILLIVICIFRPQGLVPAKRSIKYLENYSSNKGKFGNLFKRNKTNI